MHILTGLKFKEKTGRERHLFMYMYIPNDLKNVLEILNIARFVYRKTLVFNAAAITLCRTNTKSSIFSECFSL